jgi:cytochrome P450
MLAGHDTTAATLTWWVWELARNPDWQTRVRDEIGQTRAKAQERGDTDFSIQDLEGMAVMHATLKACAAHFRISAPRSLLLQEAMRLHPIVWQLAREAGQDDVIPLQFPITSTSGEKINAIPVKKGQMVEIAIASYNR